jgi:hypothetical protein
MKKLGKIFKGTLGVLMALVMGVGAMSNDAFALTGCEGESGPSAARCGACVAGGGSWSGSTCSGVEETSDLNSMIGTIINVIIWAVGLIAVFMIVFGGIQYSTSAGDSGKVKKAKDTIMYGIIGLVISLLAYAIVNFVLTNLFTAAP